MEQLLMMAVIALLLVVWGRIYYLQEEIKWLKNELYVTRNTINSLFK